LQKTKEEFFFLIWGFIGVIFVDQVYNCFIHVPSKVKVNLFLPSSYISNSQITLIQQQHSFEFLYLCAILQQHKKEKKQRLITS